MPTHMPQFWLGNSFSGTDGDLIDGPSISVNVYFSDLAMYYNSGTTFGLKECLIDRIAPIESCDWDKIFEIGVPSAFCIMSVNLLLVSYSMEQPQDRPFVSVEAKMYADSVAYLGFSTYIDDFSPISNYNNFVELTGRTTITIRRW